MADFLALLDSGLTGEYFSDPQFTTPLLSRIDAAIGFDGKGTAPETAIPAGAGSARWMGMLLAPNNGDFTFYINVNGGYSFGSGIIYNPSNSNPILKRTNSPARRSSQGRSTL